MIATLFYRFVNDDRVRSRYREVGFYQPFLAPGVPQAEMKNALAPYENVNLKLFAAMRKVAAQSVNPHQPLIIEIVETYASLFPEAQPQHCH